MITFKYKLGRFNDLKSRILNYAAGYASGPFGFIYTNENGDFLGRGEYYQGHLHLI